MLVELWQIITVIVIVCPFKVQCWIRWAIVKYKLMFRYKYLFIGSSMSHGPIQTVLRCLHNSIQFKLHLESIQLCLYFQSRQFFSFHLQTLYSLRHFVLGSVVAQVCYKSNRCPKTPQKSFNILVLIILRPFTEMITFSIMMRSWLQGWAIPGQHYYAQYYTRQTMQNYTILYTNTIQTQNN